MLTQLEMYDDGDEEDDAGEEEEDHVDDGGRWWWRVVVNWVWLCLTCCLTTRSASQGNIGRPGPPGSIGTPGQGIQGPKVGAKNLLLYVLSFQSKRPIKWSENF